MKSKKIHVTVSGTDHPGITAALMKSVMQSDAEVIDMGQSITHGLLSLSFILECSTLNDEEPELLKDLVFTAKKMNVNLEYDFLNEERGQEKIYEKYILSCVSTNGITSKFIHDIASVLATYKVNIIRIDNMDSHQFKTLEILAIGDEGQVDWNAVKSDLLKISNLHKTDLALLKDNIWRRNKRLILLDMDSTLIQSEVIVEMARLHGVYSEVHNITEQAMNGELDFNQSLKQRVDLLKGLKESELEVILKNIKLTDGAQDFIKTVKSLGYKVGIISGGFSYFANHFKELLNLDYAFSNELEIKDGVLTGKLLGEIVGASRKAILLEEIAAKEKINLEQVVAIGDGANDLEMLAKAGLGIAFHAKEIVKKSAKQHMSHGPMTSILYFLGIPGKI